MTAKDVTGIISMEMDIFPWWIFIFQVNSYDRMTSKAHWRYRSCFGEEFRLFICDFSEMQNPFSKAAYYKNLCYVAFTYNK